MFKPASGSSEFLNAWRGGAAIKAPRRTRPDQGALAKSIEQGIG
jgi:hypothetical protein